MGSLYHTSCWYRRNGTSGTLAPFMYCMLYVFLEHRRFMNRSNILLSCPGQAKITCSPDSLSGKHYLSSKLIGHAARSTCIHGWGSKEQLSGAFTKPPKSYAFWDNLPIKVLNGRLLRRLVKGSMLCNRSLSIKKGIKCNLSLTRTAKFWKLFGSWIRR